MNVVASSPGDGYWSGYASTGQTFTGVTGSWVQPNVTCNQSYNQETAYWVGLDGVSSQFVEQTGTQTECKGGHATPGLFYEFYPDPPEYPSTDTYPVDVGDSFTGTVLNSNHNFTLKLVNHTKGWTFTISKSVPNAPASSAEWVIEGVHVNAPGSANKLMSNFAPVTFTNCEDQFNGAVRPINASANIAYTFTNDVGAIEAEPSALGNNGTSFTITHVN